MDKRTNILCAAESLICEFGFYGLSMKKLSEKAGVSTGSLYRYFENKDDIINALRQHIQEEAAKKILENYSEALLLEDKFNLIWMNTFKSVLNAPERLTVMDMINFLPLTKVTSEKTVNEKSLFENKLFEPILTLYQQGINTKQFVDWEIPALVTLSFETSVTLAKKITLKRIEYNELMINNVRKASWMIIQRATHATNSK